VGSLTLLGDDRARFGATYFDTAYPVKPPCHKIHDYKRITLKISVGKWQRNFPELKERRFPTAGVVRRSPFLARSNIDAVRTCGTDP
jgi:hypothetical protein